MSRSVGPGRVSETDFLKVAEKMTTGTHKWAANHLPKLLYAEDVVFGADTTPRSVTSLFDNPTFKGGEYMYERRTLRVIIHISKTANNLFSLFCFF